MIGWNSDKKCNLDGREVIILVPKKQLPSVAHVFHSYSHVCCLYPAVCCSAVFGSANARGVHCEDERPDQ